MEPGTSHDTSGANTHPQRATSAHLSSRAALTTPLRLPALNSDRGPPSMDSDEPLSPTSSMDLMHHIPGLYRLLDLVQERGTGGMVDKVIISQESIQKFVNTIRPGSYKSEIQVDFKGLDQHTIKPRGIYGSASAIVDFLDSIGCMIDETQVSPLVL
ncbi:hypothetical protein M408DRAFT_26541 [Serendipita vermifera MAFF 305830]|uniref:Uncharacterized protein n=1 Tax=Serendipita vermifera MAFF 305830 TaxID=933852 RepID=A0A0C3AE38_SERVB|nr:hypothetical protein M408DRAFT_28361 [Serendipita vermifera MAFF 305830]KIM24931.1 hypothetical protein M408DRAFT_26541 [Serendipita vermifera MAFF 305830]